jgi:ribosome-associated toxin RatA of RatAB toxin-antitoxin module
MIEIPMIVWNMIITLVFVPILNSIRVNTQELKRLEILVNKTREEIAKEYVTKNELKDDMSILMDRIDKIGEKLDKLFEVK